jgi:hypothetical protein
MAARVVSDVPAWPGRLRFTHVLIRDTLYEGLTAARRLRLHRLAVEALEALSGEEPGTYLAELAHHCIAGGDFDKGFQYARRAGDRALALLAYEEAATPMLGCPYGEAIAARAARSRRNACMATTRPPRTVHTHDTRTSRSPSPSLLAPTRRPSTSTWEP